jgi:hypothetical protein
MPPIPPRPTPPGPVVRPGVIQGSFPGGKPRLPQPATSPLPPRPAAHPPARPGAILPTSAPRPILPPSPRPAALQPFGGAFALPPTFRLRPGGTGQRLPEPVQRKMEAFFGADFSAVRVHVGPEASSIGALAFAHGTDLYFAPGQYAPGSQHGQRLLGHELTHVVQQRAGRVRNPLGQGIAVVQDPALEAEADRMGMRAATTHVPIQAKSAGTSPLVAPFAPTSLSPIAVAANGAILPKRSPAHGSLQRKTGPILPAGRSVSDTFSTSISAPVQPRSSSAVRSGPIPVEISPPKKAGEGSYRIVAGASGLPIGSVMVHARSGSAIEVTDLKVAASHRGQGLGGLLMASALRAGLGLGRSKVVLASQDDGSGRLTRWYRGMGFEQSGVAARGYPRLEAPIGRVLAGVAPSKMNLNTSTPESIGGQATGNSIARAGSGALLPGVSLAGSSGRAMANSSLQRNTDRIRTRGSDNLILAIRPTRQLSPCIQRADHATSMDWRRTDNVISVRSRNKKHTEPWLWAGSIEVNKDNFSIAFKNFRIPPHDLHQYRVIPKKGTKGNKLWGGFSVQWTDEAGKTGIVDRYAFETPFEATTSESGKSGHTEQQFGPQLLELIDKHIRDRNEDGYRHTQPEVYTEAVALIVEIHQTYTPCSGDSGCAIYMESLMGQIAQSYKDDFAYFALRMSATQVYESGTLHTYPANLNAKPPSDREVKNLHELECADDRFKYIIVHNKLWK